MTRKIIILSGFEPFGGEKINPSWETIKKFSGEQIKNYEIKTILLPVAYKRAREIVYNTILETKPDFFIGFGQAGGITRIQLERIALNLMDSKSPDADKYVAKGEKIFSDGPLAYEATIPLEKIYEKIKREEIPVKISNHAGAYVCNLVFYTARYCVDKNSLKTKVGFIHLPYLFQQILNKDRPGFPIEYLEKAVNIVLETLVQE